MSRSCYLHIICYLLLSTSTLFAQSTTLSGTITDTATGEPLISATIKVGTSGTITDYNGQYEIALESGDYQVEVSYIGYENYTTSVLVNANTVNALDISLTETVNILQTATVSAGRYEKPLSETTVSLEILKSALIENTNATSLDIALDKVPGVNIVGGQANIRGGSGFSFGAGSRVLVLVNDLPALQADSGVPNWGDLPIENIAQVEVIKGAASALYGSAALNGIINIRTAYARSEPETKLSVFGGVFSAPKDEAKKWWADGDTRYESGLLFSHRQKFDKLDVVLGARLYTKEDPREGFGNDQGRGSIGLRYRITDRFSVGVNATLNKQENRSYFYWLDAADGIYQGSDTFGTSTPTRFYIDPFATYFDKAGNQHKFTGRFYSVENQSDREATDNSSQQYYGEYQFQRNFKEVGLVTTTGIVGSSTDISAPLFGDTTYVLTNLAAYLQLEKKVGDKLNISTGVRYEYNNIDAPQFIRGIPVPEGTTSDDRAIFRFGVNYQAHEATYIRSSWGQGFRFPTIAEKFITAQAAGFPIFPNPELASETGWSSEIGVKQGFKISNWLGYIDLAAFWMEYEEMIEFSVAVMPRADNPIPEIGFQAQNIGNTRIRGLDLSIAGQGNFGNIPTSILAGYTYVDPQFKEFTENDKARSSTEENVLKYRFRHSVKMDVESRFNKLSVGLAFFYNSNMEAIDALFEDFVIPGLKEYRAANNRGYYLLNARIAYHINEQFKASLLVKNLTNEEYSIRPGLLEPTRLVSMRLDYKF